MAENDLDLPNFFIVKYGRIETNEVMKHLFLILVSDNQILRL